MIFSVRRVVFGLLLATATRAWATATAAGNASVPTNTTDAPCHDGSCVAEVPPTNNTLAANVTVTGARNAISDLTPTGGYTLLDCSPTESVQTIRAVCSTSDGACTHITQNGAVDTVVRLPLTCGKAPFALVTNWMVAKNQTIPKNILKELNITSSAKHPTVMSLTISSNFKDLKSSRHGPVNITITTASFASNITKRDTTLNPVINLPPIDVQKTFDLVDVTVNCGILGALTVAVDANVHAHADISLGILATGTLIPPKITSFGLTSTLDGSLSAGMSFIAGFAGAPIDTGVLMLYSADLPGLNIPDILEIGPTFGISSRALIDYSANLDMEIGIAYTIQNVAWAFPPTLAGATTSSGNISPMSSDLQLSVSPSVNTQGTAEAHLTPQIAFAITALGGKASATIAFVVDAYASAGVNATASAIVNSETGVSADASACADVKTGVDGTVLATSVNIFGLKDLSTAYTVFTKEYAFFDKCFAKSTAPASRALGEDDENLLEDEEVLVENEESPVAVDATPTTASSRRARNGDLAGLKLPLTSISIQCPSFTAAPVSSVVSTSIPAASITPV